MSGKNGLSREFARAFHFGILALLWVGCADTPSPYAGGAGLRPQREGPQESSTASEEVTALVAGKGYPVEIVDDTGRSLVLSAPPQRILSLVPSATEILVALGERDRLVGRTEFDEDPSLAALPSVGGGLAPSLEILVSLSPDLIIRFDAASDPETPRRLDALGIPHLAVRPDAVADVRRIIAILGRTVDRGPAAGLMIEEMDRELAAIADRIGTVPPRKAAFLLGGDPPLVAGEGTYLHELIEVAGGVNAFADVGVLYAPVSLEEFVRRGVEVILVMEGAGIPPTLASLSVHSVPAQLPGMRVGESALAIARVFHPDLFP